MSSRRLKVFYDSKQNVEKNTSFSPSAGKPALVVKEWKHKGYEIDISAVNPVTREDFYLVHEKKHVDETLDCKRVNGFNNKLPEVAQSLYWTSGSLVSAAEHSLLYNENTCSPTSGFHHAEWWKSDGFCTFNGLMVAAVKLRYKFPNKFSSGSKIGILDIDMHYGNGTDDIIKRLSLDFIRHYTFGGAEPTSEMWQGGPKGDRWLNRLSAIIESFRDCALVIYQAGADPHKDDPFGGALSDSQLRERDRIVFTTLKEFGIPCTWNLAGGYQSPLQKVLDVHNATLEECLKVM